LPMNRLSPRGVKDTKEANSPEKIEKGERRNEGGEKIDGV